MITRVKFLNLLKVYKRVLRKTQNTFCFALCVTIVMFATILIVCVKWPPDKVSEMYLHRFNKSYYTFSTSCYLITAKNTPDRGELTLVTQLTVDRLPRLFELATFWGGPISAALYFPNEMNAKAVSNILLKQFELQSGFVKQFVNLHILFGRSDIPDEFTGYPINSLRQLAQDCAQTDYVFMVDVDFLPSKDLRSVLETELHKPSFDPATNLLVVPIFATLDTTALKVYAELQSKANLLQMEKFGTVAPYGGMDRKDLGYSHNATNYDVWRKLTTGTYLIQYEDGYEPYVARAVRMMPKYSPYLVGANRDKLSHLLACHMFGFKFYGIAQGFLLHMPPDPKWTSWNEDPVPTWYRPRPVYFRNEWILRHHVLPEIERNPMKSVSYRKDLITFDN